MTTPSSPPISLKDVATELGVSSVGLSLSDSRVRALAGVPSGPISLQQLEGKSAYTPMSPNIGSDQSTGGSSSSNSFFLEVAENGGVGPYTYAWSIVSEGGVGTGAYFGSTTGKTADFVISISVAFNTYVAQVQCSVTDSTSRSVGSNVATLTYSSP
jgi:hypothetical protein